MYRSDLRSTPPELQSIRTEIDDVDLALVDLIARRVALARRTAPLKAAHGLAFGNPQREAGLVRRAAELARERGIDPETVRAIFWQLVDLSHASVRAAGVREEGGRHE